MAKKSILLYGYFTIYLLIHLLMDTYVGFVLNIMPIMNKTAMSIYIKPLDKHMFCGP